jgi:hypothetical protein
MREKRTVVWERNARPARFRSESAERVRARMHPTPLTRVTDAVVERLDRFSQWLDGRTKTQELVDHDPRLSAIMLATLAGAFSVGFLLDGGDRSMAGPFFGTLAAVILAITSYGAWNRAHPLPPSHERTLRQEIAAGAHGLAGAAFMFAAMSIFNRAVEGGMGLSLPFTLFCSISAGLGVFLYRIGEREAHHRRSVLGIALWAAGWIVGKALEVSSTMLWR